jgi:hypothetical protein
MRQARTTVLLLVLFAITLLVGVWQFVSPWVIGFAGSWNSVLWSSIWTSAIVIAASGLALVLLAAGSLHMALRAAENRSDDEEPETERTAS